MYLFIDTETTGFPADLKTPETPDHQWPRMIQLALLHYDAAGILLHRYDALVRPEGFTIPEAAAARHGITQEKAMAEGQSVLTVLEHFLHLVSLSECLIAHNMGFDEQILGNELKHAGFTNVLTHKPRICTMHADTDNSVHTSHHESFTRPSLGQLYSQLFRTPYTETHDAARDIEATARCFWELHKRGLIYLPLHAAFQDKSIHT